MDDIDDFVQSSNDTLIDTDNRTRRTLEGINSDADNAISDFNDKGDVAINQFQISSDIAIDALKSSRGYNDVGTFSAGFTYENFNDVGRDDNGNPWVYLGDLSGGNTHVVAPGTVPSAFPLLYEQRSYSDHEELANRNKPNAHLSESITNNDGLTSQDTHDALKATLKAQGLSGNFGLFAKGFTYNLVDDVGIGVDGKIYTYAGSDPLPVTVAPETNPVGDLDYDVFTELKTDFDTVDEAVNYRFIDKLLGRTVYISERTAYFSVVETSSVLPTGGAVIQSLVSPAYSLNLNIDKTDVDLSWLGAKPGEDATNIANEALNIDGVKSISIPTCQLSGKVYINTGQKVFLDGDIVITNNVPLGATATFADVMNACTFVNKKGFQTTLDFIGSGSIIGAVSASGKFLPNQNHNAPDDGEQGIALIQRSGRVYSNRVRYTPNNAPYAVACFCITENTKVELSDVRNMGAGVFAYHSINGKYNITGKDIGTDYINGSFVTDLLGGSFGCVFLGKALNYGNKVNAIGYDCNDVVTYDGICRGNQGTIVSYEDSEDSGARNHRVYELSDNCRGNNFTVTANGGGRFEHVVYQDSCDNNYVNLTSLDSQSRCVNLRRKCKGNTVELTAREWNRGDVGTSAIELFQSSGSEGCDNNKINASLYTSFAGKDAYSEIVNDAGKYHKNNDVKITNTSAFILGYNFADTNGDVQKGTLISGSDKSMSASLSTPEIIDDTTTFAYMLGTISGGVGLSSVRPPFRSQVVGCRCYVFGDFTGGTIDVQLQKFDGTTFVDIETLTLTTTEKDLSVDIRDRFLAFALTDTQSYRFRVVPSAYTGTGCTVYVTSTFNETV